MRKQLLRGCCLLLSLLLLPGLWACGTDNASETRPSAASEAAVTETAAAVQPETTEPAAPTLPETTEPAGEAAITPGKHPREEGFSAAFNVMTLTDGSLSVSLHQQIYEEARLRAAAGTLRQDLEAVLAFTGEAEVPLEVFIVPHIVETNARVIGSRIFCTPEDLDAIRKAQEACIVIDFEMSADELYDLQCTQLDERGSKDVLSRELVRSVANESRNRGQGFIARAKDPEGHTHAAVFVVWDKHSAWELISAIHPDFRASGASTLVVWEAMQKAAEQTKAWDFEGSMIENVESSFRQFGGVPVPYYELFKKAKLIQLIELCKR